MTEAYHGLVVYRAKKKWEVLQAAGIESVELDDLIQAGLLGLMQAQSRFEPERGVGFATFAMPRVDGAILDYLRLHDPLTIRERQKVKTLQEAQAALTALLERPPSIAEIAQHLSCSEEEISRTEALVILLLSLDAPSKSESDGAPTVPRQIPASTQTPEVTMLHQELAQSLQHCLDTLATIERQVVMFRFWGDMTQVQIGNQLGLSRSHVQRYESQAKRHLRQCLGRKGWTVQDIMPMVDVEAC